MYTVEDREILPEKTRPDEHAVPVLEIPSGMDYTTVRHTGRQTKGRRRHGTIGTERTIAFLARKETLNIVVCSVVVKGHEYPAREEWCMDCSYISLNLFKSILNTLLLLHAVPLGD